jgi:glycine/D-amino acid oxidase-like deaminating enzyme
VQVERREVIIVGAGPAGAATALRVAQRAPALAPGTLLLDKARHPRDKTCAGGVIPKASALLASLGVPLDVPQARVDAAAVAIPGRSLAIAGDDLCRVVRRRELDARLAFAARDRGVELREDSRVRAVVRDGRGVRVETENATAGAAWCGARWSRPTRAWSVARSCATSRRPARHGMDTCAGATISISGPSPAACAATAGRSRAGSTARRT